jgi:hypothetical protein
VAEADEYDHPCLTQSAFFSAAEDVPPSPKGLVCDLVRQLADRAPCLERGKNMDTAGSNQSIQDDVLHLGSATKLTAEEIAKAVAHHKRHHSGDQPAQAAAKAGGGKKGKNGK